MESYECTWEIREEAKGNVLYRKKTTTIITVWTITITTAVLTASIIITTNIAYITPTTTTTTTAELFAFCFLHTQVYQQLKNHMSRSQDTLKYIPSQSGFESVTHRISRRRVNLPNQYIMSLIVPVGRGALASSCRKVHLAKRGKPIGPVKLKS